MYPGSIFLSDTSTANSSCEDCGLGPIYLNLNLNTTISICLFVGFVAVFCVNICDNICGLM